MTRGLGVRGLVEKHGKLSVHIALEFCALVGEHAGKFVSQIGVQVRTNLSTVNAYSWKDVVGGAHLLTRTHLDMGLVAKR
nr:hypothetical protein CFP56_40905 [Quercus suber]